MFLPIFFAIFTLVYGHQVTVGENGANLFNPDTVTSVVGDTVEFQFFNGNHSVAQSNFNAPCQPSSNGFFSGYRNPASGADPAVFVIKVTDTNPIWVYCTQGDHCNTGMAMVINPLASGNNLAAYKSAAKSAILMVPPTIQGGFYSTCVLGQDYTKPPCSASNVSVTAGPSSMASSTTMEAMSTMLGTSTGSAAASTSSAFAVPARAWQGLPAVGMAGLGAVGLAAAWWA